MLGWSLFRARPSATAYCNTATRPVPPNVAGGIDLDDEPAVAALFARVRPAVIVQCAGVCDVENCERSPEFAWQVNVEAMRNREPESEALGKYARAHAILAGAAEDIDRGPESLAGLLRGWTDRLDLPRLGAFGVGEADLPRIVADSRGGSMKTNPIALSDAEVAEVVRRRL